MVRTYLLLELNLFFKFDFNMLRYSCFKQNHDPQHGPVFQNGVRPGARLIKRRTTWRMANLVVTLGLSQEKRLNCVSSKGVNVRRTKNRS